MADATDQERFERYFGKAKARWPQVAEDVRKAIAHAAYIAGVNDGRENLLTR